MLRLLLLSPWTAVVSLLVLSTVVNGSLLPNPCEEVQKTLRENDEELMDGERGACRCYTSAVAIHHHHEIDYTKGENVRRWVGCTRQEVLIVHKALNALPPDTSLFRLWIWDSLIPVIPVDLFSKTRPKHLLIESSGVGDFDIGALDPLGSSSANGEGGLESLELKNNALRSVNARLFQNISWSLQRIDFSGNQIQTVNHSSFGQLPVLESLSLQNNNLKDLSNPSLRDSNTSNNDGGVGCFSGASQLKSLNLADNQLTEITAGMFKGLGQLEHLNLEHNLIGSIHPDAFQPLQSLKTLKLAHNLLTSITIRPGQLTRLQKLHLNNNSFSAFDDIQIQGEARRQIQVFSLDQNQLKTVPARQFDGFEALKSLSLSANNISQLDSASFSGLSQLNTLSLQQNLIPAIPDRTFLPLKAVNHLFLSQNRLTEIGERTLYGLTELTVLSLAGNQISQIHRRAFASTRLLQRLYLNDNQLETIHKNLVDYIQANIYAVDLSKNPWSCSCTENSWLSRWLTERSDVVIGLEDTFCSGSSVYLSVIAGNCSAAQEAAAQDQWVTEVGISLGLLTLIILTIILIIYIVDARRQRTLFPSFGSVTGGGRNPLADIKRVPSDMAILIPKSPSSSFLSSADNINRNSYASKFFSTSPSSYKNKNNNYNHSKKLSANHQQNSAADAKKKVRFDFPPNPTLQS